MLLFYSYHVHPLYAVFVRKPMKIMYLRKVVSAPYPYLEGREFDSRRSELSRNSFRGQIPSRECHRDSQ